jgi:hypothetical protein
MNPLEDGRKATEKSTTITPQAVFNEGKSAIKEGVKILKSFASGDFSERMVEAEKGNGTDSKQAIAQQALKLKLAQLNDLSWGYNVLMSLDNKAIFVAETNYEASLLWALQEGRNTRTDVMVLSQAMLQSDSAYAKRVYQQLEVKNEPLTLRKQQNYPLYYSISMNREMRETIKDKLYVTGLAYRYAERPFDNLAVVKNNVENKFLLDYLKIDFDESATKAKMSNGDYLPAFRLLYRHYAQANDVNKVNFYENIIAKIPDNGVVTAKGIPNAGNAKSINTSFTIKQLEKGWVKVANNLYALDQELPNESYDAFLQDLVKNKDYKTLEIAKAEEVNWRSLAPSEFKEFPDERMFKYAKPTDKFFPIVNISYEGAEAYCKWITDIYNSNNANKKKYKKVIFRLPTSAEWLIAAEGGEKNLYSFRSSKPQNAKGCYLGNFNTAMDGGIFPVRVDSYYPNAIGIYTMNGNVAEMVSEKGVARGGSWEDKPEDCQNSSVKKYDKPSPAIGFRVFMEVVE